MPNTPSNQPTGGEILPKAVSDRILGFDIDIRDFIDADGIEEPIQSEAGEVAALFLILSMLYQKEGHKNHNEMVTDVMNSEKYVIAKELQRARAKGIKLSFKEPNVLEKPEASDLVTPEEYVVLMQYAIRQGKNPLISAEERGRFKNPLQAADAIAHGSREEIDRILRSLQDEINQKNPFPEGDGSEDEIDNRAIAA